MSRLGTWADNIVIQAVANLFNFRINITESALNFAASTIVSPINSNISNLRDVYIGHLNEIHYVSTEPLRPQIQPHRESENRKLILNFGNSTPNAVKFQNSNKSTRRNEYMKEYMRKKRKNTGLKKEKGRKKVDCKTKLKNLEKIREPTKG